jgi:Aldo/keto reductase family
MSTIDQSGTFVLGDRTVKRLGYGAMQLAGPSVFGPPNDRDSALAVLRETVASGVNHIDTSDFYGPHVTNQLIREARCIPTPTISLSSRKLALVVAQTNPGFLLCPARTSSTQFTTT